MKWQLRNGLGWLACFFPCFRMFDVLFALSSARLQVQLLKQQTLKSRAKRDFLRLGSSASRIEPSTAASSSSLVSNSGRRFDDPRWAQMWYLVSVAH